MLEQLTQRAKEREHNGHADDPARSRDPVDQRQSDHDEHVQGKTSHKHLPCLWRPARALPSLARCSLSLSGLHHFPAGEQHLDGANAECAANQEQQIQRKEVGELAILGRSDLTMMLPMDDAVARDVCSNHPADTGVAERVAANLREYLKVFPDAIIGDGEPFPSISDQPGWQKDYQEWLQAFRAKVGNFTSVDINWGHTN